MNQVLADEAGASRDQHTWHSCLLIAEASPTAGDSRWHPGRQ